MKKLMLAVCAVAMVAIANAGMVKWTISNVYNGNTTDLASGQVYLFDNASVSATAIAAALQGAWTDGYGSAEKGAASLKAYLNANALGSGGTAYTIAGADGTFSSPASVNNSALGLTGGTSYTLYGVVFNDGVDDFSDSTKFYVTNAKTASTKGDAATTTTTFGIGSQLNNSQIPGNWTAVVPEPTSGLLMLLGVASLALKRKRA